MLVIAKPANAQYAATMTERFEPLLVICSFPTADSARQIGTLLLEKQLAACVTLLPQATSLYRWKGAIEQSEEVIAHIKTSRTLFPHLAALLRENHPYEVPEIIATAITDISSDYRAWMIENLASD